MNGGAWIFIRHAGAVHDGHVVNRKRALVGMLVRPEGDVDAVVLHEVVEAVSIDAGESRTHHVELGAMLPIDGVAISGSMTHQHDPRMTREILRLRSFLQIGDQPLVLQGVLRPTKAGVVEVF